MRIQTKTRALLVSMIAALLLAACSAKSTPAPTAASSADQPAAEAPAAEEPTAAADAPAAPEAAGDGLFARLTGMKKADSFSSRTTMQITGDILDMPKSDGPVTIMDMEQSYSGKNSRVVVRNRSAADDKLTEVEIRIIDGKTYMKNMMGEQEQWIVLPSDQQQTSGTQNDAQQAIDSLTTNPDEAAGYKKVGTESMDGLTCDVFSTAATNLVTNSMIAAYNEQFDKVTKAEIRVLMCPDGQMHQFKMEIVGTSKKSPGTPASLVFETRMFDFGKNIAIETPKNVMEMPAP